jgi:hypothetical protein
MNCSRSVIPKTRAAIISAPTTRASLVSKPKLNSAPERPHVERLIGSIRRESLDHLIVFGEAHLHDVLKAYASYYNEVRTHLSLDKDAPEFRRTQKTGHIAAIPILGGLHHQYVRV